MKGAEKHSRRNIALISRKRIPHRKDSASAKGGAPEKGTCSRDRLIHLFPYRGGTFRTILEEKRGVAAIRGNMLLEKRRKRKRERGTLRCAARRKRAVLTTGVPQPERGEKEGFSNPASVR